MESVLARDLRKSFGKHEALRGLTLEAAEGEVFGVVGPNGSGKTTTLRILATLIRPDSGTIEINGIDALRYPERVRRIISYVAEESGTYKNITGLEYLQMVASIYSEDEAVQRDMVEAGVELSGLAERIRDRTKTYSKGMKRRLEVARALMVKPRVAILDEPTANLDVTYAHYIRQGIRDYVRASGATAIVSSHNMFEVEELCDRVALIYMGSVVSVGTPQELKGGHRTLEEAFLEMIGK